MWSKINISTIDFYCLTNVHETGTKKRAAVIGALQTPVVSLLNLSQMYGILTIKIFQQ